MCRHNWSTQTTKKKCQACPVRKLKRYLWAMYVSNENKWTVMLLGLQPSVLFFSGLIIHFLGFKKYANSSSVLLSLEFSIPEYRCVFVIYIVNSWFLFMLVPFCVHSVLVSSPCLVSVFCYPFFSSVWSPCVLSPWLYGFPVLPSCYILSPDPRVSPILSLQSSLCVSSCVHPFCVPLKSVKSLFL